jgi:simple sugar transport system ATP-binding protein
MKRIPVIEMVGINKSFPGVRANKNINFRVYPGEIHALLGENGAGKSTLMSILAGLYRPDSGTIKVKDSPVRLRSPRLALQAGIGMIYQHFRLVNNLTVAENVVLGYPGGIRTRGDQIEQRVRELSAKYGMAVDPHARISHLSLGEQQRVEILKMLYRGCDTLIMDEPTTVLTPQEVKDLFNTLRLMADQGKAVVLITHKLNEVMEIADYVTVLRRGEVVGSDHIENLDEHALTHMMVSRDVIFQELNRTTQSGPTVFEIKGLTVPSDQGHAAVRQADLQLHQGEIMAIAGVAGNGQRELVEAMAGLRPITAGSIRMQGKEISHLPARLRTAMGLTLIPEDRMGMGLVPNTSVVENAMLRNYQFPEYRRGGLLNYAKLESYTRSLIERHQIMVADIHHPVNYLSGGNLQKLLLGRELDLNPKVLVAAYPVRGLDVAAAQAVNEMMLEQRSKGTAILLILEDLDDVFRLADRVAVMYDGEIQAVLDVSETDIDSIGALMLGAQRVGV